ncbi:helix-turn-helix domain-containing protein [Pseudonocardia sp. ICBG162]|uniref:helix-turn-helix domain-containing protein n=1 Tax=Pseudonocardia sp. ICBG162 TaxID=2846761 RepID=UPI001CF6B1A0|nr:helix-turn-helix domain-containing protein [Pseudonocardia sp. ICBG162]
MTAGASPDSSLSVAVGSGVVKLPAFGTFLRQLRQQSQRGRRPDAGMSRAELATLAQRGVSYITKLEQGEAQAPSFALIESLADALKVSDAERQHLHDLSSFRPTDPPAAPRAPSITTANKAYVDNLAPALSGFVDAAWNVIYANPVYARIYRHIDDPEIGNVLLWFFFVPESRRIMMEWEREAHLTVDWLRGLMVDNHLYGLDCTDLMKKLSRSPEFCRMWEDGDVALGRHKEEMLVRDLDRGTTLHLRAQVLKWPEPASSLQLYLGVDVGPPDSTSAS